MPLFRPPNVARLKALGKVEELTKAAHYKKDPAVAAAACAALTEMLDFVIEALADKNLRKVLVCRNALKAIGQPAIDKLSFILDKGHLHRRQDAAFTLGFIGVPDSAAIDALCRALRHSDPLLRMIAAQALGKVGDLRARPPLRRATADENEQVAKAATKALQRLTV
jgi:HEAT repeat protein